jgi:predicted metal-dependent TIM-barrel fold hydrolase
VTLFDAQLNPVALREGDLSDLRFFGVVGALAPAAAVTPATREVLRRAWDALAPAATRRLARAGLAGYAAIGIHPRSIPLRGLEALLADLPEWLGRRGVVAIGAIGLDEGGPREEPVFARQLELARELRRPVVVHTPWRDKARVTRRTLAILREHELDPARVLVSRADGRTVKMIRACGYAAGVSLSSSIAGEPIDEAVRLVRSLGPEGLVLSSDAGDGAGDLLALPRAAARMAKAGLSPAVIRRVCGSNALAVLGIAADALRGRTADATSPSGPRASR